MKSNKLKNYRAIELSSSSGQLLLEVLVSIGVVVAIIAIGSQIIYVSTRSNQLSGEKSIALGLADETFEAVRAVSIENWQSLFNLTKDSNYYTASSSGKWVLSSGSESVTIDSKIYARSFIIQNICRDNSSRNITGITDSSGVATTCSGSGGSHDPSTQKITATITTPSTNIISAIDYITRWRNKVCVQTIWATMDVNASTTCASIPATSKVSASSSIVSTSSNESIQLSQ